MDLKRDQGTTILQCALNDYPKSADTSGNYCVEYLIKNIAVHEKLDSRPMLIQFLSLPLLRTFVINTR